MLGHVRAPVEHAGREADRAAPRRHRDERGVHGEAGAATIGDSMRAHGYCGITISVVTMPNMPFGPSACVRM